MNATTVTHRVRWFVWAWNGERKERMPRTANMRGRWDYDAECSCGWSTHTGGATRAYIEREVWFHKHVDIDGPQLPL